jgi:hypothetical protein
MNLEEKHKLSIRYIVRGRDICQMSVGTNSKWLSYMSQEAGAVNCPTVAPNCRSSNLTLLRTSPN